MTGWHYPVCGPGRKMKVRGGGRPGSGRSCRRLCRGAALRGSIGRARCSGRSPGRWGDHRSGFAGTLLRVTAALVIALAWTIPVGVAIGTNRRLAAWLQPLVQIAASVPATALFPVCSCCCWPARRAQPGRRAAHADGHAVVSAVQYHRRGQRYSPGPQIYRRPAAIEPRGRWRYLDSAGPFSLYHHRRDHRQRRGLERQHRRRIHRFRRPRPSPPPASALSSRRPPRPATIRCCWPPP